VFVERLWRSLKYEEVHLKAYADGREAFARDIGDVDLLMVPGIQGEATPVADTGQNPFIGMWTFLHVPDVAVPAGKGPRGLPVDVQLIGRRGDDARHLIRARRIEEILQ